MIVVASAGLAASALAAGCVDGPQGASSSTAAPSAAPSTARSTFSIPKPGPSAVTSATAPSGPPCGGLGAKFEKDGIFQNTCQLTTPHEAGELPPPLAWEPCAAGKDRAAPPDKCVELALPKGWSGGAALDASHDVPVLATGGRVGECVLFAAVKPDGSLANAAAMTASEKGRCGVPSPVAITVADGTFLMSILGAERTADRDDVVEHRGWLTGTFSTFPFAKEITKDAGQEANAIGAKIWAGSGGDFGALDGSGPKMFKLGDKRGASATAVAGDAVVGVDADGHRIGVQESSGDAKEIYKAGDGVRISAIAADAKTVAWIEQHDKDCTLVASPFAKTSGGVKPKKLGAVGCKDRIGALDGDLIVVGRSIVKASGDARWELEEALCGAPTGEKRTFCQARIIGVGGGDVYWQEGSALRRAPLASFGPPAAPTKGDDAKKPK